jgi:serine/threonine protein kinase
MRWPAEVRWNAFTFSQGDCLAGRYLVEKPLGHGRRGQVYAVHDRLLGQAVALKTLDGTRCDHQAAVAGLLAEVRLGRRVAHPNVCRVYDLGLHLEHGRDMHFATMQLVSGRSLESVLRDQRLSVPQALLIARQVLLGLQALHGAELLHRDVKSANIMLSGSKEELRAVVIDFGRAQCLRDPSLKAPLLSPGSADLFSVGVLLYEMLTARRPFSSTGLSSSTDALKRERQLAPPSRECDGVGPELDALVMRCLDPNPERRYADAGALISGLDALPA